MNSAYWGNAGWPRTWKTWISANMGNLWNSVQRRGKFITICVIIMVLGLKWPKSREFSDMVAVRWWPVILLELMWNDPWHMKVIITFTFCCNNLWNSIIYGSGKTWKTVGIFPPTLWSPLSVCICLSLSVKTLKLLVKICSDFVRICAMMNPRID